MAVKCRAGENKLGSVGSAHRGACLKASSDIGGSADGAGSSARRSRLISRARDVAGGAAPGADRSPCARTRQTCDRKIRAPLPDYSQCIHARQCVNVLVRSSECKKTFRSSLHVAARLRVTLLFSANSVGIELLSVPSDLYQ